MTNEKPWSVWGISDADEPEDHVLAGMRYRDFDDVMLLLAPDGEPGDPDWYGAPRTSDERPTRPSHAKHVADWIEYETKGEDLIDDVNPVTDSEPPYVSVALCNGKRFHLTVVKQEKE